MATGRTLNAMISQIAFELGNRSDLGSAVITRAINDAIEIYQKERFRFNELTPQAPYTLNTIQGVAFYGAAVAPHIPTFYAIDYLNVLVGGINTQMTRCAPEEIYLALDDTQSSGPPSDWAWDGQSIIIYPRPPAQSYQITVGGYMQVAGPADPATDTTNPWMNEAERLIRSRAKYELALHVTRNANMVSAMSPDEPPAGQQGGACWRYYNELKSEANKIRGTSRVHAMQF